MHRRPPTFADTGREAGDGRDLDRFGLLYLRHGRWRDQQVIPTQWIEESTRPYSTTNSGSGYGYLWWTSARVATGLPAGSYFAAGNGGQYVFVIPADDLVIVHLVSMRSVPGSPPAGVTSLQIFRLISLILAAEPTNQ